MVKIIKVNKLQLRRKQVRRNETKIWTLIKRAVIATNHGILTTEDKSVEFESSLPRRASMRIHELRTASLPTSCRIYEATLVFPGTRIKCGYTAVSYSV